MAGAKKFGTFGGVFTPSILTILGAIMYLRFGQIVGNAGLSLMIVIVVVAHVISVATGLSISSIATDKKVGAGGVYYVLSRSLGLPIGGALGMTLFVATALSIALYMVAFAEVFNQYIGFGYVLNELGEQVVNPNISLINTYRITGSLALLFLTVIAFISTSVAIKSQYIILGAIVLSLFAIFLGDGSQMTVAPADLEITDKLGFAALFAIFFPAVTGFTAGVAMSGDLKDPKKAIPVGTMGAIIVGLVVYLGLGIFIYYSIDENTLITNSNALIEWATVAILVYIGVWGATLSSALGGILGGPRILQAMSVDKLTPKIFAKGVGESNEPRNALILTVIIAEAGVLIGDLNVIAEVVSMFYLAAYGFINLSFFLESWASSDFNPTFKVNKWVGLLGFLATFTIMSQINLLAMFAAFIIIGGVYFYLSRKQIALGTGDIWQSVWATIVKKGLKRMEVGNDHKRNWKPNTLLFSADDKYRSKMIEFSKAVSGQGGIITNFDLHENPKAKVLFPKSKEIVKDEELEKYGIFGRKLEVQNTFKGIESIACTFGFSGIEPNTVLMNWPGQTKNPIWFKDMTEKLIALDLNVLYLDYDPRWGFRKKEQIDLWWRGVGNNSELMLSLAKFITGSPDWSHANIRILLVNDTNIDFKIVENRIKIVVEQFRVKAEIKVINNAIDGKPIYDLMKMHSSEADLVFVGIPEIESDDRVEFVERTNNLVSVIGSTLLVKASSQFEETDLKLEQISLKHEPRKLEQTELVDLIEGEDKLFHKAILSLDGEFEKLATNLNQLGIQPIEDYHHAIFSKVIDKMDSFLLGLNEGLTVEEIQNALKIVLNEVRDFYADALVNQLPIVYESLEQEIQTYFDAKEKLVTYLPKTIEIKLVKDENGVLIEGKRKIIYRDLIRRVWYADGMKNDFASLLEFGYQNLILLHQSKNILHDVIWKLLTNLKEDGIKAEALSHCKTELDIALHQVDNEALHLASNLYRNLRNAERTNLNEFAMSVLDKKYRQNIETKYKGLASKEFKIVQKGVRSFPSYWYRNLILFTYHLKSDIYLIAYTAKIQNLSLEINNYLNENYYQKINKNIFEIEKQLNTLKKCIEEDKQDDILGTALRISEELFFNSEQIISILLQGVNEMNEGIPEEIELMTAKSINGIREVQGNEIVTENIALKDITDYIARTYFVDPIHERIQVFNEQLKRTTRKFLNETVRIQKGIDNYSISGKINLLKEIIEQAEIEINTIKDDFKTAQDGFESELLDRQDILRKELDINQIIEQVETLRQYVKQQKRRNVILDKFKQVNKKTTKRVSNLFNYLIQKQQDFSATEYKRKYNYVVSEQGQLAEFVESISSNVDLPFYYQQLFTGTYYTDSNTIENRKVEIQKIQSAITRINEGCTGGVLILGNAGSGKTYLAAHVSSHLLTGKVYKILPPVKRNWSKEDLIKGFQRATGITEPIAKLLNKLPAHSSIILEDIEQWWLKAENGHLIIDELTKIINKFGGKHYFVLTANIHSFTLVSQATNIQNAISQSVILAPLNPVQIKDVIWSRHQSGGLRIQLDNEKQQHISVNKLKKYLMRYHVTSSGNIGLALQQWIGAFVGRKDNVLQIENPVLHEFPFIEKEEWKNLIFQLFIHYNLSREELYRIYGDENKNWINRLLQSMKNAGVIEQNERGEFLIKKTVKPYVENWLKEYGFIK